MTDLQKARQDLWPAARKRAAEEVMEKVKQEASLRAAEAIQKNMTEDAERTAAELERQEREAAERAAELAAAEAQFEQFREQLLRKIVARMQQNAVQEFFDKWIDFHQDIMVERGIVQEHPDHPHGQVNPPPRPTKPTPQVVAQATELPEEGSEKEPDGTVGSADAAALGAVDSDAAAAADEEENPSSDQAEKEEEDEEDEQEGKDPARIGATLESDPAEVLQQG